MRFRWAALVAFLAVLVAGSSAAAATTVYPVSHFNNVGVSNPNRLLGSNPNTNNIQRLDSIGLNYGTDITNFALSFVVTSTNNRTIWLSVRVGRRTGLLFTGATAPGLLTPLGLPTQNIFVQIAGPGTYWISTSVYGASCVTLGGCNAITFSNSLFSQNGANFQLSMVGATPEPQVWALMLLGFIGVAARLKQVRSEPSLATP